MVSAYALKLDLQYPIMDPRKAILHLYKTRFMPSLMVLALQGHFTKLRKRFENESNKEKKNELLKNLKQTDLELTHLEQKDFQKAQAKYRQENKVKQIAAAQQQLEKPAPVEMPTP